MGNSTSRIIGLMSFILVFSFSCTYKFVDDNNFIGTWVLEGRNIYSGMSIKIEKAEDEFIGRIIQPPNNKYQDFFLKDEIWVTQITRSANYYFKLTESKIAKDIFSTYELPTTNEYYAFFSKDKKRIYLTDKMPSISNKETKIYYRKTDE